MTQRAWWPTVGPIPTQVVFDLCGELSPATAVLQELRDASALCEEIPKHVLSAERKGATAIPPNERNARAIATTAAPAMSHARRAFKGPGALLGMFGMMISQSRARSNGQPLLANQRPDLKPVALAGARGMGVAGWEQRPSFIRFGEKAVCRHGVRSCVGRKHRLPSQLGPESGLRLEQTHPSRVLKPRPSHFQAHREEQFA